MFSYRFRNKQCTFLEMKPHQSTDGIKMISTFMYHGIYIRQNNINVLPWKLYDTFLLVKYIKKKLEGRPT